jgi:hypothetical protein
MKVLITVLCLVATAQLLYGQDSCHAIIDVEYYGAVNVYDKPHGKVIHQMKNDTTNEDYLSLRIIEQTDSFFYVSISMAIKYDPKKGWIRKADYIGAYKKHESNPMLLILCEDSRYPDIRQIVISQWKPSLMAIEKCAGEWTLVSLNFNSKRYIGWIRSNELCANSYTYCN